MSFKSLNFRWWTIPVALGILLLFIAVGFSLWGLTPSPAMPQAVSAMQSDSQVVVDAAKWLVFNPVGMQPTTGFIFYPGGHVAAEAYAPFARAIAARGFLVVIVPMPLSLAVLNIDAAADVMAAYPQIAVWAAGGHSLGGSMAANFAYRHPGILKGLVFWASYPAATDDLSRSGLKVISISASMDGLATPDKINASHPLLPEGTIWLEIMGGDHAQFGWYGIQSGDNPAQITREAQQIQTVDATATLLASLK